MEFVTGDSVGHCPSVKLGPMSWTSALSWVASHFSGLIFSLKGLDPFFIFKELWNVDLKSDCLITSSRKPRLRSHPGFCGTSTLKQVPFAQLCKLLKAIQLPENGLAMSITTEESSDR